MSKPVYPWQANCQPPGRLERAVTRADALFAVVPAWVLKAVAMLVFFGAAWCISFRSGPVAWLGIDDVTELAVVTMLLAVLVIVGSLAAIAVWIHRRARRDLVPRATVVTRS